MKTKFKQTEIGMIPEDWEIKSIDTVAEVVGGGTPSTKNSQYWDGDISWITPKDLSNFKFRHIDKGDRNITKKGLENSSAKLVPQNTVLLTTRAPVGYLAISKKEVSTNQGFRSLIPRDGIKTEFLFYLLKNNVEILKSNSSGTTFGELSGGRLKALQFAFPDVFEQSAIAKILSDIDSKIELNQNMNKTLEEIGQAIFKHWFVDFEFPNEQGKPYMSSGGEMIDSEIGEIPKGLEVGKLGSFIEFVKGKKPLEISHAPIDGYLPQILIENLDGKKPIYAKPNKMTIVHEAEPIMVMDGASSGRIEVGYNGILGSTLAKITISSDPLSNSYVFNYLKTRQEEINQNTTGTSIPHTDKDRIKRFLIVLPHRELLVSFDKLFFKLLYSILNSKKEIELLSQIRDSLLPKLMSGEIRVPVETN
ncbi:MAG: hypothetical protein FJ356_06915 [Thaumarchaeota archaeon]|nr:hypothetical protein [Nitrososphaerota archaeon]